MAESIRNHPQRNFASVAFEEGARDLRGKAGQVLFRDPTSSFMVLTVRDEVSGRTVQVVGCMDEPQAGKTVAFSGLRYGRDSRTGRYGYYLTNESKRLSPVGPALGELKYDQSLGARTDLPKLTLKLVLDRAAVEKLLREFDGVGPSMANRLICAFDPDGEVGLLDALDSGNPRLIAAKSGISPHICDGLIRQWRERPGVNRARALIMSLGLHKRQTELALDRAMRAMSRSGQQADPVRAAYRIAQHPYRLTMIDGIGFSTADAAAQRLGLPRDSSQRIAAGAREAIAIAARESGDTIVPLWELAEATAQLLSGTKRRRRVNEASAAPAPAIDPVSIAKVIWGLDENDGIVFPKGRNDALDVVTSPQFAEAEAMIARRAVAMMRAPLRATVQPPSAQELDRIAGRELDEVQRDAVNSALNAGLFIITGGPGSGKTTILKAVIGAFAAADLTIQLAAPTGAAARRMRDAIGLPSATIHTVLGSQGFGRGFRFCAEQPLQTDVLVVDEATMKDALLAASVFEAMPLGARLILVGDQDQLASVGPGAVLADLIASGIPPVARLRRIRRQADGPTVRLLQNVRDGVPEIPPPDGEQLRIDQLNSRERIAKATIERYIDLREGGLASDGVVILTPMNIGPAGVHALNERIQALVNPKALDLGLAIGGEASGGNKVIAGPDDRVMFRANDKDLGLANGDVGTVLGVGRSKRSLIARFGDAEVEIFGYKLMQLNLAYAGSVHKAQGSEYPHVIFSVCPDHKAMLRRNLIYTAVTRHRECLHLIGDMDAIIYGIHQVQDTQRRTLLQELIRDEAMRAGPAIKTFESSFPGLARPSFSKDALLAMMESA